MAKTAKQIATDMVDKEFKELREVLIYFTERALDWQQINKWGPLDERIVMMELLKALIRAHGSETTSSIDDTLPRDMILGAISREVEEKSNLYKEYFTDRMGDEERFNYELAEELGFADTIYQIANKYFKTRGIPATRAFDEDNYNAMVDFLISFKGPELDACKANAAQMDQIIEHKLGR